MGTIGWHILRLRPLRRSAVLAEGFGCACRAATGHAKAATINYSHVRIVLRAPHLRSAAGRFANAFGTLSCANPTAQYPTLKTALRVWRSDSVERVKVWLAPAVAAEIKDRKWLAGQTVEDMEGGVLVSGEVAGLAEVERWVLGYGDEAEVIEPRALRESVARKLRAGAARYEREAAHRRRIDRR